VGVITIFREFAVRRSVSSEGKFFFGPTSCPLWNKSSLGRSEGRDELGGLVKNGW